MSEGLRQILEKAHAALSAADIDHALIGGLALGVLGIHRSTLDVDFLVDGRQREAAVDRMSAVGFKLVAETPEVVHFSGAGPVDLLLANRPHSLAMLARAQVSGALGLKCIGAEDLIGLKIQAYINEPRRALQDQADIASLIEKHPDLDWVRIKEYADLFDEWPKLSEFRNQYEP